MNDHGRGKRRGRTIRMKQVPDNNIEFILICERMQYFSFCHGELSTILGESKELLIHTNRNKAPSTDFTIGSSLNNRYFSK